MRKKATTGNVLVVAFFIARDVTEPNVVPGHLISRSGTENGKLTVRQASLVDAHNPSEPVKTASSISGS